MRTKPDLVLSPRSGRPTVAQRFTAGGEFKERFGVRKADD